MDLINRLLDLVQQALGELDSPDCRVSSAIRKATRIAILRNDYPNLLWLRSQMISVSDSEASLRLREEVVPHFTKQEFSVMIKRMREGFVEERRILNVVDEGRDGIRLVDNQNIRI